MWSIYAFKLAYAEDNSFELRVNTNWSCAEFVEKVTAVARVTFPSISVTDEIHITESWNQSRDPNYNQMPTEENRPIPLITQTIAQRYQPNHMTELHFYIYFRDECQAIQLRHSRDESRTIEQVSVCVEYYYDIWVSEMDNDRVTQRFRNLMPTGSNERETSDRHERSSDRHYILQGAFNENSVAVSLDDMIVPQDMEFHLPRNLFDDVENEAGFNTFTQTISNDFFHSLDRNNIINYANELNPFWSIPEITDINPLAFDNIPPTSYTPQIMSTHDCCICFTESTQCFTLQHCNHTVCGTCYVGVYTRVNGDIDLRCPMCRIPDSFNNDVYRQIVGIDV